MNILWLYLFSLWFLAGTESVAKSAEQPVLPPPKAAAEQTAPQTGQAVPPQTENLGQTVPQTENLGQTVPTENSGQTATQTENSGQDATQKEESGAHKQILGKYNLKSVDSNMCCFAESQLISCENMCPPEYDKHFIIHREGFKYTFQCPDTRFWVSLREPDKFSDGRSLFCSSKREPAEFEVHLVSKDKNGDNEYVFLLADGSGACNLEPEFWKSPETKIECHKDVPTDAYPDVFKFQFLDDMGKKCNKCGDDLRNKSTEELAKLEEQRRKEAAQAKVEQEARAKERAQQKAAAEAAAQKKGPGEKQQNPEGCPPCECDGAMVKNVLGGVIDFESPDLQANNGVVSGHTTEVSVASTEVISRHSIFKVGFYVLAFSHAFWFLVFLRPRKQAASIETRLLEENF